MGYGLFQYYKGKGKGECSLGCVKRKYAFSAYNWDFEDLIFILKKCYFQYLNDPLSTPLMFLLLCLFPFSSVQLLVTKPMIDSLKDGH